MLYKYTSKHTFILNLVWLLYKFTIQQKQQARDLHLSSFEAYMNSEMPV